jgi:hypothetical protein
VSRNSWPRGTSEGPGAAPHSPSQAATRKNFPVFQALETTIHDVSGLHERGVSPLHMVEFALTFMHPYERCINIEMSLVRSKLKSTVQPG